MNEVAISVKQPWAYLLCANIKPIENRTWPLPEKYKGKKVYIHASGKPDKEPYMLFDDEQIDATDNIIMDVLDSYDQTSSIIGYVEFTDCVINHPSIWAEKSNYVPKSLISKIHTPKEWIIDVNGNVVYKKDVIYNWVVSNAVLFDKPIENVKGRLSFWDCSEYITSTISEYGKSGKLLSSEDVDNILNEMEQIYKPTPSYKHGKEY